MRKDLDYFIENKTASDLQSFLLSKKDLGKLSNLYGFHLGPDANSWISFLAEHLSSGQGFPIQMCSGPMLTLKLWSSFSPELISLLNENKVRLVLHLPFVLTFYKNPSTLGYQVSALRELSDYLRSIGVWEKVSVLFHCGHPLFSSDGKFINSSGVDQAKEFFIKNVFNVSSLFSSVFIENLPSWKGAPSDYTSPGFLYDSYFKEALLPANVGLALDTEHLHAQGIKCSAIAEPVWSKIGFIHLNAHPLNAPFGQNVDLHSYTRITSCLATDNCYSEDLAVVISKIKEYQIPSVFERKVMSVQIDDLLYLEG